MTERTGGSDVGAGETVTRKEGDTWRLYGTKWFTLATTSQMTLPLGRPEGNGLGGRGLEHAPRGGPGPRLRSSFRHRRHQPHPRSPLDDANLLAKG